MSALSDLRDDLNSLATSLHRVFGGDGKSPVLELKPGQVVVDQAEIDTLKSQLEALAAIVKHVEDNPGGSNAGADNATGQGEPSAPGQGPAPAGSDVSAAHPAPGVYDGSKDHDGSPSAVTQPNTSVTPPAGADRNPPSDGSLLPENAVNTTPPPIEANSPSKGAIVSTNDAPAPKP